MKIFITICLVIFINLFLFLRLSAYEQILLSDDRETLDNFGSSVAISGSWVIVGAYWENAKGKLSGSAYFFQNIDSGWVQSEKITPADGDENAKFGFSSSIDGDYAIIGAHDDGKHGSYGGAAYIFRYNYPLGQWVEEARLVPKDQMAGDRLGFAVDIEGDCAVVAASNNDEARGAVYVFMRDGGAWTEKQKLTASDKEPVATFGFSVCLKGDMLIVGAPYDNEGGHMAGAAYIFKKSTADGAWNQVQKLHASDQAKGHNFGNSVAINSNTIIVGAPLADGIGKGDGAAYIFGYDGSKWVEKKKLIDTMTELGQEFGYTVALNNNLAFIAKRQDLIDDHPWGSVFIYKANGDEWLFQKKLWAAEGVQSDLYGHTMHADGQNLIIGAPTKDIGGKISGAAYIYSDFLSTMDGDENPGQIWNKYSVSNSPNPFSQMTKIEFKLEQPANVSIRIYDCLGNEVQATAEGIKEAGLHTLVFDGSPYPPGIYYYKLLLGDVSTYGKMILIK